MSFLLSTGDLHPRVSAGGFPRGLCIQGRCASPQSDNTGYGQRAGGTHPTGMHSCGKCFYRHGICCKCLVLYGVLKIGRVPNESTIKTTFFIGVFPKWSRTFAELRENDKSLKHKLGSIKRSNVSHVSCWRRGSMLVSYTRSGWVAGSSPFNVINFCHRIRRIQ